MKCSLPALRRSVTGAACALLIASSPVRHRPHHPLKMRFAPGPPRWKAN